MKILKSSVAFEAIERPAKTFTSWWLIFEIDCAARELNHLADETRRLILKCFLAVFLSQVGSTQLVVEGGSFVEK